MLCFPNCKINLGLYVTRRREDGYHDLETVFYPVQLRDVLEVVPARATHMHLSGLAVAGTSNDNLVWKAYELLQHQYPGQIPSLDIYLHKVIPMGAGMGGGSADGAFTLRLLNDFCQLNIPKQQLADYALQLGSDCPFFIYNTPQFATGRGEQMQDTPLDLSAYSLQLICPQVHIATGKAFQLITPRLAPFDLRQLHSLPLSQWKDIISNDFEAPVFQAHPVLAAIKAQLYAQGAVYAAMSGSGSTIFGIFPKGQKADVQANVTMQTYYME